MLKVSQETILELTRELVTDKPLLIGLEGSETLGCT